MTSIRRVTNAILPAERLGTATVVDGCIDVGGVKVPWPYYPDGEAVYVRRSSTDLSVMEIHLTQHDGLAQEELDHQNAEAQRYPGGPDAYWKRATS